MPVVLGIPIWLLVIAFVLVSVVLASVRNDFVEGVGEAANFFARAFDRAAEWLLRPQGSIGTIPGFERAALFAALFLLIGPADALMMAARVGALLGVEETAIPGGIGIWIGLAVILGEVVFVLAYLDLAAKQQPPPWDELPESVIAFIRRHALQLAIATALTTGALWLWGAMAVTGLYFDGLGWVLTAALGLELAGAAGIAFAVGRRAFRALILGFLALLGGLCKLVVVLLDGLAGALTKLVDILEILGRRIWDWFAGTGVGRWLNLRPIPPRTPRPRIGGTAGGADYLLDETEEIMKVKPRYTVLGIGKFGADVAQEVRTADVAWGVLDKDRLSVGLSAPAAVLNGAANVSPGGQTLGRGQLSATESMFDRASDVHIEKEVSNGVTTAVAAAEDVIPFLVRQAKRFSDERFVVVSPHGDHGSCRDESNGFLNVHYELEAPLVAKASYEGFVSLSASVINALHVASEQYPQNFAFGQLIELLLEHGRCYGFRSHSEVCAPGRLVPVFGSIVKRFGGFTPSYGDPLDVLNRARTACDVALTDDSAGAVNEPIDHDRPFAAVFRLPLPPRHPGFAPTIRQLDSWLRFTYPHALAVYASGNGIAPVVAKEKERWAQCTILFPLSVTRSENGDTRRPRRRRDRSS